jgi:hypothetical protein
MTQDINAGFGANVAALASLDGSSVASIGGIGLKSTYLFECYDKHGHLKWTETVDNLVVNVGLNDVLTQYFKGASYTAAFYVGLKDSGTIAAGDTMASHAGWTEDTNYSNANRPTLTLGSVSGQSVDNSASKAVFNINGTATIAGAFVSTSNTKGGTTGTLYGAADFGASRAVLSTDTLNVTITLTASAS